MKLSKQILVFIGLVSLVGCSHTSHTSKNMLTGMGIGTVSGAAIGALVGKDIFFGNVFVPTFSVVGAGVGLGVGLLGGYIYDRVKYGKSEF